MTRSLRDIIEWALHMDGDQPRPSPTELGQQVARRIRDEDATRERNAMLDAADEDD